MPSARIRQIIHLDMDAFYASVEMLDSPALRGEPVIVGGSSNRGVVSAASYEARKYGIHSAMPLATARKLCPGGVFLPVRMARYREISRRIMAIFHRFTPLVEPISLDEAFLDVTASISLMGKAEDIAREIKNLVRREIGLTVSAGVAPSKLVAKIASDLEKPDGLTVVEPGDEKAFLDPLPMERLWGVGKNTRKTLALIGVRTIGDLTRLPLPVLTSKFGRHGAQMHRSARGVDDREVTPEREAKSMGHEATFAKDLISPAALERELLALSRKVGKRLRRHGVLGKTVTLKVKYHDFKQITRSHSLDRPTCDDREIYRCLKGLLPKTEAGKKPIRLLGVSAANIVPALKGTEQLNLFPTGGQTGKRRQLHSAVDTITGKFGAQAILPAKLLERDEEEEGSNTAGRPVPGQDQG